MTPVVRTLLIATVAAYFLQMVLPGLESAFLFVPQLAWRQPWTFVTYMFLHGGLSHLFFNMLGLFFFGSRVEGRLGDRAFATLYFVSGISGAILSLFLSRAPILGASGGVYGVMLAFAYYWPDERIFIWGVIPVPARLLVLGTTLLSLFSGLTGGGAGVAHFAHLGGFVGAFAYLRWLERGRGRFKKQVTAVPAEVNRKLRGYGAIDRSRIHEVNRTEVDRILDKISAQGLGSLTEKEQLFLSNFVPMDDRM